MCRHFDKADGGLRGQSPSPGQAKPSQTKPGQAQPPPRSTSASASVSSFRLRPFWLLALALPFCLLKNLPKIQSVYPQGEQ